MMDLIIDNWPALVALAVVVPALWLARLTGVSKGILIGRGQVIREYYLKKERRL